MGEAVFRYCTTTVVGFHLNSLFFPDITPVEAWSSKGLQWWTFGIAEAGFFYRDKTELEPRFGQELKPNLNSNVQAPELNQTPPYKEPNRTQTHMSW